MDLSHGTSFKDLVGSGSTGIIGILNTTIVPLISILSFAVFVWGVAQRFIIHGGDEKKREEGKEFAFWGLIGLVVLFSVWSLVNILLSTLGIAPSA
jgi:hypothetical protein